MSTLLTCPRGHRWQAEAGSPPVCPVCGARVEEPTLAPPDSTQAPAGDGDAHTTHVHPLPPLPTGPAGAHATLTLAPTPPPGDGSGVSLPPPEEPTIRPPRPEPAPGVREGIEVPGYEILAELGRGGMGVVYKARQVALDRVVALKMILAGGHAGEHDLERFQLEAEAVAQLRHPNIVQIYDVGEQGGLPFFALEFVDGGSLAAKLDGTPLPPRPAARLVQTLARAVEHAHRHGIVHRDLKPANVLLATEEAEGRADRSPFGVPKITDF